MPTYRQFWNCVDLVEGAGQHTEQQAIDLVDRTFLEMGLYNEEEADE